MNANSILNYQADVEEDYYKILGCDPSASEEQIITEFKIKAKSCHPDKAKESQDAAEFQKLNKAKEVLTNPEERKTYDKWLGSGMAMTYKQWRGLKSAVHTSLHWATPKTLGRMLESDKEETFTEKVSRCVKQISLSETSEPATSKRAESNTGEGKGNEMAKQESAKTKLTSATSVDGEPDDLRTYPPTDLNDLGIRVDSPPPEWGWDDPDWNEGEVAKEAKAEEDDTLSEMASTSAVAAPPSNGIDERRKKFAQRQDSSVGAVMIFDKLSDNEMRKKFRNYEI